MINTRLLNEQSNILTLLSLYGITPNFAGFISCIVHKEKTPSMKVYPQTNSLHCFACGADFNSISFIMHMENCSFLQACEKLKKLFMLGDLSETSDYIRIRQAKKNKEIKLHNEFINLCNKLHFYEKIYYTIVPFPLTDEFKSDDFLTDFAFNLAKEIKNIENEIDKIITML